FAEGLDDGWAAFAVETSSYEWLTVDGKRGRFLALLGALEAIQADVQILRVGRSWDVDRYARELQAELAAAGRGTRTEDRVRARAPGGLPARAPRAWGGAAVAGAPCVLPRTGRAGHRRPARTERTAVRTQRRGDAGAAGGRRAALDRQPRGAAGQVVAGRVRA